MSGHRPEKLGNNFAALGVVAMDEIEKSGATLLIQGMASGFDLLCAKYAWLLGIPFMGIKPWAGHKPRVADRMDYRKAEDRAKQIISTDPSKDYPGPWVYQRRNEYMVDNCDFMLSCWDGRHFGGTWNCIEYALSREVHVTNINPITLEVTNLGPETISV